jgi:signal transduction histidine kinase/CheY-like chemotaxis protein
LTHSEPDRPPASPPDAVRVEQVRMLYAEGTAGYATTVAGAALLTSVLVWQGVLDLRIVAVFLAALVAQTAARLAVRRAYLRAGPEADWRPWAQRYVMGAAASGLIWGAALPFLMAPGRLDLQVLVLGAMLFGTYSFVGATSAYRPAFYTFFLPFPSLVIWLASRGDLLHVAMGGVIVLWLMTVTNIGHRHGDTILEALELRFENAAQRHAAEQASIAKSRFLASASHDLRQPVHAIGMFMGALRGHQLPKQSLELIDHIDASIGALDELFTSLLDISRLDAGVTVTKPYAMPVQPLLDRICRDVSAEATAKGLKVRCLRSAAVIRSDPVLLERILRNIVVNAVRYTERGGIVIGARRRAGRLSIEVWDTGPGIARGQREAIFQEFYQLSNPDRDRAKGLGLGLAIVRRLSDILGHPVSVDSRLGHGSVFRVSAPIAQEPAISAARAETVLASLRTGFIVAIDDEAAVRVAMGQLLRGWGHLVVVAAGEAEAMAALADHPRKPDLIICDYRLQDGENGLDVIRRLQAEYNEEIPALLVTGDTAPERIREAESSGYPLLHKPLSHARLRAAVQNLISGAAAPRPESAEADA